MATKKSAVAAAKTAAPTTPVKAEAVKTEAVKAEAVKTETAKKEPVKAETVKKPVVKAAEKKEAAKKPAAKKPAAKKAELISDVHIQFDGKSYTQEDLLKIAKDVWKYDLKQKAGDLVSIELYVKPEESMAYYVMNKDFTGSFYI